MPTPFLVTASQALLEIQGGLQRLEFPYLHVDSEGTILAIHAEDPRTDPTLEHLAVHNLGNQLLLPGFINAHSHAFQRKIRGLTGRRGHGDPSSFWSWRQAMYSSANALDPEGVQAASRSCFSEMLAAGITCVGEFHYLHHLPDGQNYADPNELSRRVLAAADEVGIRLALLEVYYARAGEGRDPLPEQRRFCDRSLDHYFARVDDLSADLGNNFGAESRSKAPMRTLGLAPHSVRAVGRKDLHEIARYADAAGLVVHAHVSEQRQENEQCAAEYGMTPTQVFAEAGCLQRPGKFTAVHAIHVDAKDHQLLANQNVCACPTTEADLGDGIVPASRYLSAGTTLSLGSDSNSVIDLIQEARHLEMNERLANQARLRLAGDDGQVVPTLVDAATRGGAAALGRPELGRLAIGCPFDAVVIDLRHRSLEDVPAKFALDALFLAGSSAPVAQVWIGGQRRL